MTAPLIFPAPLRQRPQWVCWRYVDRPDPHTGAIHATKVPVCPASGRAASSTDPRTWGPLAQAVGRTRLDPALGLGFVFVAGGGLVGVDLDGCRDPTTGALSLFAQRVLADLPTYTEITPSGQGLHLLLTGTLPGARCRTTVNAQPVELYDRARFFTMTGQRLPGTPGYVAWGGAALTAVYGRLFPAPPPPPAPVATVLGEVPLADTAILRIAGAARNGAKFRALWRGDTSGYASGSEADLALLGLLSFYTTDRAQLDRLFRHSGLAREKWEQRADYREHSLDRVCGGGRATFRGRAA